MERNQRIWLHAHFIFSGRDWGNGPCLSFRNRPKTNQSRRSKDESYIKELGDILVAILRFARIKKIDLNKSIMYSLNKIKKRKFKPKI
jgi:hypothetical protein